MYTWLCRVMALIFTFNILSPAYAQTPVRRPRRYKMPGEEAMERVRADAARAGATVDSLYNARGQYINEYSAELEAALEAFDSASTSEEIDAAYQKLDQLRRTGSGVIQNYKRQIGAAVESAMNADNSVTFEYYRQNPHVAPDAISQTMGRDMRFRYSQEQIFRASESVPGFANCPSSQDFLDKLKNNKFENMEEMLDYLDPMGMNCTDYLAVAYAAETLYYGVEEFTRADSVPAEQAEELKVFFAHAQKRASESLKRLNKVTAQNESLYMARGTLRILLAFLQNAVEANHLQMNEKTLYFVRPAISKAAYNRQEAARRASVENQRVLDGPRPMYLSMSYSDFMRQGSYFSLTRPKATKGMKVEKVTFSSLDQHPAAKRAMENGNFNRLVGFQGDPLSFLSATDGVPPALGQEFLNELRAFKEQNPEADSKEFTLLQLDMQYAAQFAVLTGNFAMLSEMVNMFEEKPGKNIHGQYTQHHATDFNTKYSAVLSALFNSVYETLNGFNVARGYSPTFLFLEEMAGPAHATDTRVLALGTLGMLTQPTDSTDAPYLRAEMVLNEDGEQTNKFWLSYKDRFKFGQYVADIYAPLQKTHYLALEDYGLNAEQMLALSDQLVGIYMNFLPLEAPTVTLGPCMRVEKMDTENRTIVTRNTFHDQSQGWFRSGDCQVFYTDGGTFVFTSNGTVEMLINNHINWKKKTDEITMKGMEILGEALLWVFGGAIIGGAFRGLRLLAGVAKSLPRAIRSGKIVYNATKGTRVYRMTAAARRTQASLKVGSKYMTQGNFNAHLASNGMAYTVEHTAAEPGLVRASSALTHGARPSIPSPATRVTAIAADAQQGVWRGATFGVYPEGLVGMPLPVQRAQYLRFLQPRGMLNTWSSAERMLFQENVMFNSFNSKYPNAVDVFSEVATLRNPWTGVFYSGERITGIHSNVASGLLLAESPTLSAFGKAYWGTVKFFGGFKLLDTAGAMLWKQPFEGWMARKSEEAVAQESAQYGDSLSPDALAELEAQNGGEATAAPSDVMDRVGGMPKEKFSWVDALTLPSWAWQQIAPAEADAVDGASILPLFMGGKYVLSQTGVGSNPFMTDATRAQLALNAHRVDLARARIGKVNTQLAEGVDSLLADIEAAKRQWTADFAQLKQNFPGDWSAEEQAALRMYDDYAAEVRASSEIVKIGDRSKKLEEINKKYEQELGRLNGMVMQKQDSLLLAQVAPKGEAAFFRDYIAGYEQLISDSVVQVQNTDIPAAPAQAWISGYEQAGRIFIDKLKVIAVKNVSFSVKCSELSAAQEEFEQKVMRLNATLKSTLSSVTPAASAEPGSRSASDYSDMLSE